MEVRPDVPLLGTARHALEHNDRSQRWTSLGDFVTLAQAKLEQLDVFFFGSDTQRAEWCATHIRETTTFEEPVGRFTLICAAVTRRTKPKMTVIEAV